MIARIKPGCGVSGISRYAAGSSLTLTPYVSPEGETIPGLFVDTWGTVWPASQVVIQVPNAEHCQDCGKPLCSRVMASGPFVVTVKCCPHCMIEEVCR